MRRLSAQDPTRQITQASHGFSVGQLVYYNGTAWVLSQANSAAASEVMGMVTSVVSTSVFAIMQLAGGRVTGLSGLTAGAAYFLSPTTAGAMTATAPNTVGQVFKPVFIADSTTSGIYMLVAGQVLTSTMPVKRTATVTASSNTFTPNVNAADIDLLAPTAASTIANMTGTPSDGQTVLLRIKATAAYAITWGTMYSSSGVASLPTSTVANKTVTVGLTYDAAAAKLVCLAVDAVGY